MKTNLFAASFLAISLASCSSIAPKQDIKTVSKTIKIEKTESPAIPEVPADYTGVYVKGKLGDDKLKSYQAQGLASWYSDKFEGRKTANGEIYDPGSLTAAHKTLPLPALVKVTNLDNGKIVIVRVNDRGPFNEDRVIDLSKKAAQNIGLGSKGLAPVKVEFLEKETEELYKTLKLKK